MKLLPLRNCKNTLSVTYSRGPKAAILTLKIDLGSRLWWRQIQLQGSLEGVGPENQDV
jgi:hypothetical protein